MCVRKCRRARAILRRKHSSGGEYLVASLENLASGVPQRNRALLDRQEEVPVYAVVRQGPTHPADA
jgi:hypothetical protein